ncbi:MAG: hypothetical protein HYZ68_05480 [Chloroflexi bacterium]|nr:hypothetical protein [Chloroflexota bacterium]
MSPPLVLSILLASLYAGLFHMLWGGSARRLALFWLLSLIGFGVGDILAETSGLALITIGRVHLLWGTLGSWGAMALARRLKL